MKTLFDWLASQDPSWGFDSLAALVSVAWIAWTLRGNKSHRAPPKAEPLETNSEQPQPTPLTVRPKLIVLPGGKTTEETIDESWFPAVFVLGQVVDPNTRIKVIIVLVVFLIVSPIVGGWLSGDDDDNGDS